MEHSNGSLHAQYAQIERVLDAVVAAGRARRWPEYRRHLGTLAEGLGQHMACEEEAVFPQHAEIRRLLEMLGAAVPEQDPAGCLAALEELAGALRIHHEAEIALDPDYATRPAPPLELRESPAMDLRGLQPPEPMVRIFQVLERGQGAPLRVILPHEPVPLYGMLRERGYAYAGSPRTDGGFELLITEESRS